MPENQLRCPHCESLLKLHGELAAGTSITCPKCGADFKPGAPRVQIEIEEEPEPARVARRPARASAAPAPAASGAVIAFVVILCLVLIGVGVGIGLMNWQSLDDTKTARAEGVATIASAPIVPQKPRPPRSKEPEVGQEAPEIEGEDIDGKTFKLSDYRGKVVVLDFWGHW
jgi:hypothetical protein